MRVNLRQLTQDVVDVTGLTPGEVQRLVSALRLYRETGPHCDAGGRPTCSNCALLSDLENL